MTKDWRDEIEEGDVLRFPNGTFRIVRMVSYKRSGFMCNCYFTIKHASWTGRCHTIMNRTDLAFRGAQPTHVKIKLNREFDHEIRAAMSDFTPRWIKPIT